MRGETMVDKQEASSTGLWLHVGLWTVQILLAVAFGFSGWMKATMPVGELVETMAWAQAVPVWLVRFIGISEVAGALGLVLPSVTKIRPQLTVYAALGLVVVMVLAALFHVVRAEFGFIVVNGILGGLAAFVAWGRRVARPIELRS